MKSRILRALVVCAALFPAVTYVVFAAISLSTSSPVTQNFDGIGTTATASLPVDFRADKLSVSTSQVRTVGTFAGAATATQIVGGANLSTSATNGIYNFGSGTTTTGADRAVGFLSSSGGTFSGNLYAQLVNNTAGGLASLAISYDVEKYRRGSNPSGFRIQLFYSVDGTAWTSAGSDFLTSFAADTDNNGYTPAPGVTVSVNKTLPVAIPAGSNFYLAWNYSVSATSTATNAQALAIDNISILGVAAASPTNPTGTMTASPNTVSAGDSITLTVTVTPGTNPASTGIGVTGNLTAIGLGMPAFANQGNNVFTFTGTIPSGVTGGTKSVTATITDTENRTGTTSPATQITVLSPTVPTGGGSASPSSVPPGGTTQLSISVIPGANPTSSSLAVTGDLSAIGGSAALPFQLTTGNTFTASATVAIATSFGAKALPITISDAEGRSSTFSLPMTVIPPGAGKVIINEVDADTPGSDTAEFIELYDGGVGNTPLDGLVVVLYDGQTGAGKQSYAAFDLDGYVTDANGYFVLGNPGVPGVGLVFNPGDFGLLQNGPDAVALYIGNATDFPNGTNVTTTNLLDAIVYGTDDPSASGLLPLLNAGQMIVNENATGNGQTQSSRRCPNGMGGFRNTSTYYPGTPTPGAVNTCPTLRPASDVVISQVYGGGGNSGATYHNDFVELFNRGGAPVDLTGWSLQYASSTGNGWASNLQPLGGAIGAGQYYLVALGSGGTIGASLPAANISGLINMAAGSGKIALVNSFEGLVGNCPIYDPSIRDFVGYGSADCGEGSTTTAAGGNATAQFRKGNGGIDTDNNASDFGAAALPNPRRTAPIVELGPLVLSTDPRANGFNAPRDATIQVTFTEPVTVDSAWFNLTCASSGQHNSATFASSFGGQDQYITPNDNFTAGEQCTVTILKDRVHDVDLDDVGPNTDTLPANVSWSFTVASGTEPPYPPGVHLTMGNPSGASTTDPSNYLIVKPEYALSYNRDLGRPNWVSWHLSDEWTGTLTRVDTFRPDPAVPADWYRVQAFDFSGSGFDRGHMTPNADRDKETSVPINQATFLMSNMVAQAPANNQGPWAALEGYLRTLVETPLQNELYIVSGPAGVGGTGSNLDQNHQPFVTTALADGHVTVPASTWKVALVLPKESGDDVSRVTCSTRTIAVIMPNTQAIDSNWQTYLTTVDAVEALTGYDFFSNLPEPIQRCVEAGTNGVNPPLVKGDQTITFAPLAARTFGDADFTVSATASSGLAVNLSIKSGPATISGGTVHLIAPGSVTILAQQPGNGIYNGAPDVERSFDVAKAGATIAVTGYSGVYDGGSHGATGAATGINGEDLAGLLNLGASFVGVPGGTANWSFAGNTNYAEASGTASIVITKTDAAFSNLASPMIADVDASVPLSGKVASGALVPTGTVAITLNGVTQNAPVQTDGGFSASFNTSGLPPASATFPIGYNYVGDGNFNGTAGTGTLTVNDTTPPALTLNGAASVTVEAMSAFVDPGATATDARAGNLTGAIAVTGAVDTHTPGTYTLTYTVSDGVNTSTTTRTIRVVDTTPPVLTLAGLPAITIEAGAAWTDPGATATDTRAGNLTAAIQRTGTVNPVVPGTYALTYTVTDGYNTVTASRTVTVVDTTAPDITTVSASPSVLSPPDHKMVDVTVGYLSSDLTSAPVCSLSVASNEAANANGDGNTAVDWQVLDAHHLQVRSERAGGGSGRLYTITVTCADTFGNHASQTTTVTVPK